MIFQSTLPYGSDRYVVLKGSAGSGFQSTLPYGSDPGALSMQKLQRLISIHAPLRERLLLANRWNLLKIFQSTLPYGSDMYLGEFNDKTCISIHAPLRERLWDSKLLPVITRFQSTLPYGSDFWSNSRTSCRRKFQSTLPYGSDQRANKTAGSEVISIHAPLRERPWGPLKYYTSVIISIHAPLRERRKCLLRLITDCGFQSTLPYGSDQWFRFAYRRPELFQSTLPYGSDYMRFKTIFDTYISIHAPLRERLYHRDRHHHYT